MTDSTVAVTTASLDEQALGREVRAFVAEQVTALGRRHGRTERECWTVNEELLAAGPPVAAHWIGDRHSGPAILNTHRALHRSRRSAP